MRNRISLRLAVILAAACLAGACGQSDRDKTPAPKTPPNYMIYSPNGEPLNGSILGKPTCEQAMNGWFNRLSAGGSTITRDVFLADANAMFVRMDIDHRGYIVSEELDRFREQYRQPQAIDKSADQEEEEETPQHKGKGKHGKKESKAGSGLSDPTLSSADPVMSADTNLDFKVTPQEFRIKSQATFDKLDTNHDGVLDRTEITSLCTKKP